MMYVMLSIAHIDNSLHHLLGLKIYYVNKVSRFCCLFRLAGVYTFHSFGTDSFFGLT